MTLKLDMQHQVLKYYQVCSNGDPGLTFTYFTTRSNLVPYALVWQKEKTMNFPETIVVCDLKLATDDRSDKKFLFIFIYLDPISDRFLFIWIPFCFISVFESTAYLKFTKLQYVSSGFCCRVITGSQMRLY